MSQPAATYLHRKCRRCGRWSTTRNEARSWECPACRAPYGPLVLGLDVQSKSATQPELTGRDAPVKGQLRAVKLEAPKEGDFDYVSPIRKVRTLGSIEVDPVIERLAAAQADPENCSNCGRPLATHDECGEFG